MILSKDLPTSKCTCERTGDPMKVRVIRFLVGTWIDQAHNYLRVQIPVSDSSSGWHPGTIDKPRAGIPEKRAQEAERLQRQNLYRLRQPTTPSQHHPKRPKSKPCFFEEPIYDSSPDRRRTTLWLSAGQLAETASTQLFLRMTFSLRSILVKAQQRSNTLAIISASYACSKC